jgi:hypothetical protein
VVGLEEEGQIPKSWVASIRRAVKDGSLWRAPYRFGDPEYGAHRALWRIFDRSRQEQTPQ